MTLIALVVALVLVGLMLWAVTAIPMDQTIRRIIQVVVIVAVVLWLIGSLVGDGAASEVFNLRLW